MKATSIMIACALFTSACTREDTPTRVPSPVEHNALVNPTVADFEKADPGIHTFVDQAYGYIVFPAIGKGGLVVGAAHGTGYVYEQRRLIGKAKANQVSLGLQAGGESYAEIVFFKDKQAMDKFKAGEFQLGAHASAVIVQSGAAATAGYDEGGYAVFVKTNGGAMAEASVGGQSMSFEPYGQP